MNRRRQEGDDGVAGEGKEEQEDGRWKMRRRRWGMEEKKEVKRGNDGSKKMEDREEMRRLLPDAVGMKENTRP
jgi:hypothetical protein